MKGAPTGPDVTRAVLAWLHSAPALRLLFWVNLLGTAGGYAWYWDQLRETAAEKPFWLLPFVPDSPTASLFFSLSLLFLMAERHPVRRTAVGRLAGVRALVDALAVVTLFKYGVWAVVINFADGWQGGGIDPLQWMLIVSHAGMAIEAIVYAGRLAYGMPALLAASAWTLLNDALDYGLKIHPWLYPPLLDDVPVIGAFTVFMSAVSIGLAAALRPRRAKRGAGADG
mgnify:FL=1|jgi:uncharacterized membrane protein YpjA